MVSLETPVCNFGEPAVDFALPGVDGNVWSLQDCKGENGLLVMFICNHCPYVKAIRERIVRDTKELLEHGVKSVAIMANDPTQYEEDSFENMQKVLKRLTSPSHTCWTRPRRLPKPMGRCVPRISSGTTGIWPCSIGVGSTPAVRTPHLQMPVGICLMQCCRWRKRVRDLRSKSRVWAVPLNG